MDNIIRRVLLRKKPVAELNRADGKVWYLPHHGIYHPTKPGKIRVVFNCSATYRGISLNDDLLQDPDMTNNLLKVLMRFRQEKVAVIGGHRMYVLPGTDNKGWLRSFEIRVVVEWCSQIRTYDVPDEGTPVWRNVLAKLFQLCYSSDCWRQQRIFHPLICDALENNLLEEAFCPR